MYYGQGLISRDYVLKEIDKVIENNKNETRFMSLLSAMKEAKDIIMSVPITYVDTGDDRK